MSHPDDITANRHGGNEQSDAAFESILESLSETKRRVLAACFRPGGVSCRELAEEWEVGLNVISGRFSQLKRDNLIVKHEVRDGSAAYIPNPSKFPHAPRPTN